MAQKMGGAILNKAEPDSEAVIQGTFRAALLHSYQHRTREETYSRGTKGKTF